MDRTIIEGALTAPNLWFECFEKVTSTNDLLKEMAAEGAPERGVLIAEAQTAGKGRKGRSFYSPEKTGLYLSILLRPSFPAKEALSITTIAAVAAAQAIEKVSGKQTGIKWVNDVYLNGKKCVGILTEAASDEGETLKWAVMGIGFNLYEPEGGFPEEIKDIAGAIFEKGERKEEPVRELLSAAFLNAFFKLYDALPEKTYMEAYRARSLAIGRTVELYSSTHEKLENEPPVMVIGIGDEAELLVQYPDGTVKTVFSGDISIRPV